MTNRIRDYRDIPADAKLWFVGIGGISMCGLAEITLEQGYHVSGSDMHASEHTRHLESLGVEVTIGQMAENIDRLMPDLVIYSAAVPLSNSELQRAQELGITAVERGLFLGWLTREFDKVINVAGTHGKTTTTAMIASILLDAKLDPTVHLGAKLLDFGDSTVHIGESGKLLVSEACEYHNSFLSSKSTTATVLNIDADHLDYFGTIDRVIDTFADFSTQVQADGWLILPKDGAHIALMLENLRKRNSANGRGLPPLVFFGEKKPGLDGLEPDISYSDLSYIDGLPDFDVYWRGEYLTHIHLNIPGAHNILNALAAIACALLNGGDANVISQSLGKFRGADGRFTIKGQYKGAQVVVDYAHHPTAVEATLAAANTVPHKNTWVVFQPLTYNRTKILFDEFVQALLPSPNLYLVEIYSDREQDTLGMSSRLLVDALQAAGTEACFCDGFEEVKAILDKNVEEGDLILFLGPEDVRNYADKLMA